MSARVAGNGANWLGGTYSGSHERKGSSLVDFAYQAAGIGKDGADGGVSKDLPVFAGKSHMGVDVVLALCAVKSGQPEPEVDALADGLVDFLGELGLELALADNDERHGVLAVHLVVEEEAGFLQHFM